VETGKVLIVGAVVVGGWWLLSRFNGSVLPPGATTDGPGLTTGLQPPPDKRLEDAVAKAAGRTAGAIGSAVGSRFLGPAGQLVGAQASTDTSYNVHHIAGEVHTIASVVTGHEGVWAGTKSIAGGALQAGIQPLKTTYHIVAGLFS